ncbi:MAG: FAD-dependent oxidoreductase [Silvanigrellaceae bacterium]
MSRHSLSRKSQFTSLTLLIVAVACKKSNTPPSVAESESQQAASASIVGCDVIILGGTTAAYAAAITAADNMKAGEVVCLTEPTDWLGGQLTSSGVPAVDFAHHESEVPGFGKVKLSDASRDTASMPKFFAQWMTNLGPVSGRRVSFASPPVCWVSVRCFPPTKLLPNINSLAATYESSGRLRVFKNTVVKAIKTSGKRIVSVTVIQHISKGSDPVRLSEQIRDWYSPNSSAAFDKKTFRLAAPSKSSNSGSNYFPVVIDATEWGEGLVLSGANYLQGIERNDSAPVGQGSQETCGQAIVYPMTLRINETPQPDSALARGRWTSEIQPQIAAYKESLVNRGLLAPGSSLYSIATAKPFTFDDVWSYRRIVLGPVTRTKEKVSGFFPTAQIGDISNQNWELGNDYPYRYLFLPIKDAKSQAASGDWTGGIDVQALAEAELQAWGWVDHLRKNATVYWNGEKRDIGPHVVLSEALGTPYGLSKVPYIRDTRRSIGFGGDGNPFVLKYGEIHSGTRFEDSIAIGAYASDRHPSRNPNVDGQRCASSVNPPGYNPYPQPFTLPLRSHTNESIENLLVAGKTIAQTFHTNSATRLHPIEFSSGTGAGAMASFMAQAQISAHFIVKSPKHIALVQERTRKYQPIEWSADVLMAASNLPKPTPTPSPKTDKTTTDDPSTQK